MGTSGLVGVFGAISASEGVLSPFMIALSIAICLFIIPALISLLVSEFLRKKQIIKFGDLKLPE